jgi:hypothetical protein
MVLQLCGRVCRRLSFKNPSSFDEGFFILEYFFNCGRKCLKPPKNGSRTNLGGKCQNKIRDLQSKNLR